MSALTLQRCLNHPPREAAARCVDCNSHFCRECVEEHDGKLRCAACLRKAARPSVFRRAVLKNVFIFTQTIVALLFLWITFFTLGKTLLTIPESFHEGDLWKKIGADL
jgi:hypothetical protein